MNNFNFPLPPPPPPRAHDDNVDHDRSVSWRGHLHDRGGRGPYRGRGRGEGSHRGGSRGNPRGSFTTQDRGFHNHQNVKRQKTELGAFDPHTQQRHGSQGVRPRVTVPPPVPSFGGMYPLSLAKQPIAAVSKPSMVLPGASAEQKKDRSVNQLGLTPQGEQYESSEEEDIDEAAYTVKPSGPLQIEHNGEVFVLRTREDIARYVEERRKRWPTRARVEEKEKLKAEQMEKLKAERRAATERLVERKKAEAEAKKAAQHAQEKEEQQSVLGKEKAKLERLREKIARQEAVLAKTIAQGETTTRVLHNPSAHSDTENAKPDRNVRPAKSTVGGQEEEALSPEGLSPTSSSDESAPEEASTTLSTGRSAAWAKKNKLPMCKMFLRTGQCRFGEQCHFSHDLDQRRKNVERDSERQRELGRNGRTQRKSLYQQLVDREVEEECKFALRVLKQLGSEGFFRS